MASFNNDSHLAPRLWLVILVIALNGCSFIFGNSTESNIVQLDYLENNSSPFSKASSESYLYHTPDGDFLTAIEECGISQGHYKSDLTRTRQLFVGFKMVKLPEYTKKNLDGLEIDRSVVLATLDDRPISLASYIIPGKEGCLYDLVLWRSNQSSTNSKDRIKELEQQEQKLETWIAGVIKSLTKS